MKTLVVYDSMYGNTARVAAAIGEALGPEGDVQVVPVARATHELLAGAELLFVGSPTQRFRPLPSIAALLRGMPRGSLAHVWVVAFDTRIEVAKAHSAVLSFFVAVLGLSAYASRHIERALHRAGGGQTVCCGEGFFVEGMEGPLVAGELERAAEWARRVAAKARACAAAEVSAPCAEPPAGARRGVADPAERAGGPRRPAPN